MARTDLNSGNSTLATGQSHFNALDWIAQILLIVGGINWGLVGAFDFDLVATLFGSGTMLSRLVYMAVGLAGIYGLYMITKMGRGSGR